MSIDIPRFHGEKLRRLRRLRRYTQDELAERVGINVSTIGSYENDKSEPASQFVEWIAKALDIPPVMFYCEDELRAFMASRVQIEGMANADPEAPDQDAQASESSPPVLELDSEALTLFTKLPGMHSGASYSFTFVNEYGWDAVPPTEAEALSGQGVQTGASVKAHQPISTESCDGEIYIYGTDEIASALIAIGTDAAVKIVAKTIHATMLDDRTVWIAGNDGEALYEDVSGFLVEKILSLHHHHRPEEAK